MNADTMMPPGVEQNLAETADEADWALPVAEEAPPPVILVTASHPTAPHPQGWVRRGASPARSAGRGARGGRLRDSLWPPADPGWLVRRLRRGRLYGDARDAIWEFVTALRLPAYFRLGLLGFVGTLAWLFVPVTLIALGRWVPLLSLLG